MSLTNTKLNIPNLLFRGDSDSKGLRKLRQTIHHGQLQTNLINGGHGREIFEVPILSLLNKHIAIGWHLTHFLSFSESINVAYHYGLNDTKFMLEDPSDKCDFGDGEDFDFALLTFRTDQVKWNISEPGVFEGKYKPALREFSRQEVDYKIILYDVSKILKSAGDDAYSTAILNSKRDSEWLLLPATKKQFNFGRV